MRLAEGKFILAVDDVYLRLGKDGLHRIVEQRLIDILGIIPVDDAYVFKIPDPEQVARIAEKTRRLMRQFLSLFNKYSVYHLVSPYMHD